MYQTARTKRTKLPADNLLYEQRYPKGVSVLGDKRQPTFDRRCAMPQSDAAPIKFQSSATVLTMNYGNRLSKDLAEFSYRLIMPAKLILERFPSDKLRSARVDTMQPLCQPRIDIKRHCIV